MLVSWLSIIGWSSVSWMILVMLVVVVWMMLRFGSVVICVLLIEMLLWSNWCLVMDLLWCNRFFWICCRCAQFSLNVMLLSSIVRLVVW